MVLPAEGIDFLDAAPAYATVASSVTVKI